MQCPVCLTENSVDATACVACGTLLRSHEAGTPGGGSHATLLSESLAESPETLDRVARVQDEPTPEQPSSPQHQAIPAGLDEAAGMPVIQAPKSVELQSLEAFGNGSFKRKMPLPGWLLLMALVGGVMLSKAKNDAMEARTPPAPTAATTAEAPETPSSAVPPPPNTPNGTAAGPFEKVNLADGSQAQNLQISPDGGTVVGQLTATPAVVRLWDAGTGRLFQRQLPDEKAAFLSIVFSADGKLVCVGRTGNAEGPSHLTVFNHQSGSVVTAPYPLGATASDLDCPLAVSAADTRGPGLVLAVRRKDVASVDVVDGQVGAAFATLVPAAAASRVPAPHNREDTGVDFTADGRTLAAPLSGIQLQAWDIAYRKPKALLSLPDWFYQVRTISPDNDMVAVATHDGNEVALWSLNSGRRLGSRRLGATDLIYAMDFSSDGKRLAVVLKTGSVKILEGPGLELIAELVQSLPPDVTVRDVAFAPDGQSVVLATGKAAALYRWRFAQILRPSSPVAATAPRRPVSVETTLSIGRHDDRDAGPNGRGGR